MLLPGDMPIGKKVHSQLILIRKSVSLQSDIDAMPVLHEIHEHFNKQFGADCKFPLPPSASGLAWNRLAGFLIQRLLYLDPAFSGSRSFIRALQWRSAVRQISTSESDRYSSWPGWRW
jgi:hypothetical protein